MKILLDENIDVRFKNLFDNNEHVIFTVRDMNWLGIKNGILLKLLVENLFDLFITADKSFINQQNLKNLTLSILVLNVRRNLLKNITVLYPDILTVISKPLQNGIIVLNET